MNRILLTAAVLATSAILAPAAEKPLVLEKVAVYDPMVNNMLAGTIMKPSGWKIVGGMKWYTEYYHQVCFEAKIYDPNSFEQYEALQWVSATWLSNPIFPMNEGQNYMGSIVLKPRTPEQVIEQLTVPVIRKGARIVDHYPMPEIAKLFEKSTGGKVLACRTRIAYTINGQPVEEDLYLILSYAQADIGGGNISTIWQPVVAPFALRAGKGQLDAATPKLLAIAHSGWLNPKWCDQVGYVKSLFVQRMYQGIEDAGRLSRQISANNDYILGIMRASREYRNAVESRAAQNFSDYIRGVATYSGGGYNYTLPYNYSYAYGNGSSVILTNDPSYNPPGYTLLTPNR
jgi:hypothetical protein